MKIEIQKKLLHHAVGVAARACGTTMPVLQHIKMRADPEAQRLQLTGTSLDAMIETSVAAKVEGNAFAFCIPGRRFGAIIAALDDAPVSISPSGERGSSVRVKCTTSNYRLMTLQEEDFPKGIEAKGPEVQLKAGVLAAKIKAVVNAVSKDQARPQLMSVVIELSETLASVATDGRRLHRTIARDYDGKESAKFMLAEKSARLLMDILGSNDEGVVRITTGEDSVRFVVSREEGDIVMTSKVVAGGYPDYKRVIPTYTGKPITVNRGEIVAAIHRAVYAQSEKESAVRLDMDGLMLTISAGSKAQDMQVEEFVTCQNPGGVRVKTAANATFLLAALNSAQGETVDLGFADSNPEVAPIKITSTPDEFTGIVMPCRL